MSDCERFEGLIIRDPEGWDYDDMDFYLLHQEVCPSVHRDYEQQLMYYIDLDPSEFD